jgi:hypothetical protein
VWQAKQHLLVYLGQPKRSMVGRLMATCPVELYTSHASDWTKIQPSCLQPLVSTHVSFCPSYDSSLKSKFKSKHKKYFAEWRPWHEHQLYHWHWNLHEMIAKITRYIKSRLKVSDNYYKVSITGVESYTGSVRLTDSCRSLQRRLSPAAVKHIIERLTVDKLHNDREILLA